MLRNDAIAAMREDYTNDMLDIAAVHKNPLEQFAVWFKDALNSKELEANAMTLSTATKEGIPSARIVLLKGIEAEQFVFYTNYNSQKGQEIAENPHAALVFSWLSLQRQIRIQGTIRKTDEATSTEYFQSRPKGSQIGAWTSEQSDVIVDRMVLEARQKELEEMYENVDVLPRPPHWGGYQVLPTVIEFWQGRSSRLHDRIRYTKEGNDWKIERLAP